LVARILANILLRPVGEQFLELALGCLLRCSRRLYATKVAVEVTETGEGPVAAVGRLLDVDLAEGSNRGAGSEVTGPRQIAALTKQPLAFDLTPAVTDAAAVAARLAWGATSVGNRPRLSGRKDGPSLTV